MPACKAALTFTKASMPMLPPLALNTSSDGDTKVFTPMILRSSRQALQRMATGWGRHTAHLTSNGQAQAESAACPRRQMVTEGEQGGSKLLTMQSLPKHLAEHDRCQALHAAPSDLRVGQVHLVSRQGLQFRVHSLPDLPCRRAQQATTAI